MYSHSRKIIALALIAVCHAGAALAQESVAAQLQRINESIALLTAQKQELELKSQIAGKQAEIARINNTDAINIDRVRHPVVRSIEGADGKLLATLAFGSGIEQTVKQGDRISGGWLVSKIAVDAVFITRGNERARLGYGFEPPAALTAVPPLNPTGR